MLAKDRNNIKVKDILLPWQKDVDFLAASFKESVTAHVSSKRYLK